ncbi:3-hydroxybutyryl-CoA dehydrogenase, partial [Acinetobacter baumannii]|nr:3-hydroxybutyryl-CoA dehydrogenase [Acinetobacter baumannii]
VVGAGQMGSGIAQVAAQAGYEVVLRDVEQRFLERGLAGIQRSLGKLLEKGRLTQKQYDAALANLKTTLTLEALEDCDLIVEAIVENEATKAELFRELDTLVQPGAILASNTSSIPITRLAAYTRRPERFIGMHFMNPVPLMELVE